MRLISRARCAQLRVDTFEDVDVAAEGCCGLSFAEEFVMDALADSHDSCDFGDCPLLEVFDCNEALLFK
jgi:hypothetical protein